MCVCGRERERERERKKDSGVCVCVWVCVDMFSCRERERNEEKRESWGRNGEYEASSPGLFTQNQPTFLPSQPLVFRRDSKRASRPHPRAGQALYSMSGESEQTPCVSIRFTGCPLVDGRGCTSNPSLVKTQAEIRNLKPRKYLGERVVVESEEPLAFDEGPAERPVHHADRHQPVGGLEFWG